MVWQYLDGKAHKKFGLRGSAALEAAYQEKKPFAEWTDKQGGRHKASLRNWKVEFQGKSFSIRRFEPGKSNQFGLHVKLWDEKCIHVDLYDEYTCIQYFNTSGSVCQDMGPHLPPATGECTPPAKYTVSEKLHPFIVVIYLSDFIRSCQFWTETYSRKFGTKTNAQATASRFICSYCTM